MWMLIKRMDDDDTAGNPGDCMSGQIDLFGNVGKSAARVQWCGHVIQNKTPPRQEGVRWVSHPVIPPLQCKVAKHFA
jgi:hypothetical protein